MDALNHFSKCGKSPIVDVPPLTLLDQMQLCYIPPHLD